MDIYSSNFLLILFILFSALAYIIGLVTIAKSAYNYYNSTNKNMTLEKRPNVSILSIFFSVLLTIILLYLFSAIWSDLDRIVASSYEVRNSSGLQDKIWILPVSPSSSLSDRAANQLNILIWHILFVLPLVMVSNLLYFESKKKGSKYNSLVIPFLVASLIMFLRLLAEVGSFVAGEYQRFGFYLIIAVLIVVIGGLAYWSQAKKEEESVIAGQ